MPIDRETRGPVAVLTLDNPGKLNALSIEMLDGIGGHLDEIEPDDAVRAVVITGAGEKAFAAGADIGHMREATVQEARDYAERGHALFARIEAFPKPVIAAINGFALGGGCELVLACDIRLAADSARLGQPEVNLGIFPGWGGTQRLPRLTTPGFAKDMIFTGRHVGAAEAHDAGLVNHLYPQAELIDRAVALGEEIAKKSPLAIAVAKRLVNEALEGDYRDALARELAAFGDAFATEDQREGMAAFFEKREPDFTGR
jgi:enoyl-CoA hydratase